MKKILKKLGLGSLIIFLFSCTNITFAFYTDVPTTHEYYNSIQNLYDQDLLPDSTIFNPDKQITILELYKIIFHYANTPQPKTINIPYSNIENDDTDAPLIQQAINYGFLMPTKGQLFNKEKTVSKHHALSLLFRSFGIGYPLFFDSNNFPFTDISATSTYGPLAMKTAQIGIYENDNPLLFKMAKRLTKAEIAHYLYLLKDYKPALTPVSIQIETVTVNSNYNSTEQELMQNENFDILLTVWNRLNQNYLYSEDLNKDELIIGAIDGLVEQIDDPYTDFQSGEEATVTIEHLNNEYEGVGMIIDETNKGIVIVSPFKDSPAEEAGLKAGDIIIAVNDINTLGQSVEEVVTQIRGPADTKVKITILRDDNELDFNVVRKKINFDTVNSEIITKNNKRIGYIEVVNFGDNTSYAFKQAALELSSSNIDGLVVDTRNNPGGYLDVAIDIISNFVPDGESSAAVKLVYSGGITETLTTVGNGILADIETVVLINEGSASASEILAGALRDLNDATIIGVTSFGKGSVQQLETFSNNSVLKYTISKWQTPNGTDIDQSGISPDIYVENTSESNDSQLDRSLNEF